MTDIDIETSQLKHKIQHRLRDVDKTLRSLENVLDGINVFDTGNVIKYSTRIDNLYKEKNKLEDYLLGIEKGVTLEEIKKLYEVQNK